MVKGVASLTLGLPVLKSLSLTTALSDAWMGSLNRNYDAETALQWC